MKYLLITAALLVAFPASASFDWDPFYEDLTATNGATFQAWRPFYSTTVNGERWRKDYLWPIYTRKGFKDETYSRFLFIGWSTDFSPDTDRHRTWVFPFYFQGTSAEGEKYFAIFPIGGTIYEFLGRDKIWFVLFPIFARSTINDLQTTSVLWPIGSRTVGGGVDRFRIWPLYGVSTRDNEFKKKFILWPLYNSVQYTNERNPGKGFVLVPIYGCVVTKRGKDQWLIPPFFRYSRGEEERVIHAPYPFIQWCDGKVYKRYVWPIYGKKHVGTLTRQFWLWPIIWNSKIEYLNTDENRRRIIPFVHYESQVVKKPFDSYVAGDVTSRYWKLWPLMSWERNGDAVRYRFLDLWPLRNTAGIERNWAPIWTLYRRESNTETVSHHLLWGLYRQSRSEDAIEWSLLKGLAGYKRNGNERCFRVLFFRMGNVEGEP